MVDNDTDDVGQYCNLSFSPIRVFNSPKHHPASVNMLNKHSVPYFVHVVTTVE